MGDKLYVFGGYVGFPVHTNLCYDPSTNGWSVKAPKNTITGAATVVAWGEEILALGGSLLESGFDQVTAVVEAYDTISNEWRVLTNLPNPSSHFGAGIHGNILYLIGGINRASGTFESFTFENKVRRFDLDSEEWMEEIDGILPRPVGATYSSACPVVNGKLIIGGGMTTIHGGFTVTNASSEIVRSQFVTIYDIESNTISTNAPLPVGFTDHLFLLAEDRIFALGGRIGPFESHEMSPVG